MRNTGMQTNFLPSVCSCCRIGGYQHRLTCEALQFATGETPTGKIIERCKNCLANLHDAPYYTIKDMPGRYCESCYADLQPVYITTNDATTCTSCGDSLLVGEVCYKFPNGKGFYCKKCYGDNTRSKGKEPDYESNKVNPITLQPAANEHFTPKHYGGDNIGVDPDKFIHLHKLNFRIGNVIKYVTRAGKKPGIPRIEDLRKALDYLQREIDSE